MRRPPYSSPSFNFSAMTRKIDVDNRISIRNYYSIADNLLKQASIYREEKNLIDLYVMLLRYSSLLSETIPYHRDYQALCLKEQIFYDKKLSAVLDELEKLKPQVRHQLDEQEKIHYANHINKFDGPNMISYASSLNRKPSLRSAISNISFGSCNSRWNISSTTTILFFLHRFHLWMDNAACEGCRLPMVQAVVVHVNTGAARAAVTVCVHTDE